MKTKSILGLLMCIVFVFSLSFAQPATAASAEEEILQVAKNWTKSITTWDFELMSSLYYHSPKTSSFSSIKNGAFLLQSYEAIENFMKPMYELPKGTITRSHHNIQVTILTDDVAVITLYEILTINPPMVKEQTINLGRQTLVVQKLGGKWLIVHDHGSVLPTE